jgi:hypothetical protein
MLLPNVMVVIFLENVKTEKGKKRMRLVVGSSRSIYGCFEIE